MMKQMLPKFDKIEVNDIPSASSYIFFDWKESLISWYSQHRIKPYWNFTGTAPVHEAIKLIGDTFLNVNKFCTVEDIDQQCFKSTRAIYTIIRNDLSDQQREEIVRYAMLSGDRPKIGFNLPSYPIRDLLRFEPMLQWIPNIKNEYFCSEKNSHIFNHFGIIDSYLKGDKSAPFHKVLYALSKPETFQIREVWVGDDYRKKWG